MNVGFTCLLTSVLMVMASGGMAFADWTTQWKDNGVPVVTTLSTQRNPQAASDGAGGTIIAWEDGRNPYYQIWAQRLDAQGNRLWGDEGVLVAAGGAEEHLFSPIVVPDGSGGAFVAWNFDISHILIAPRWQVHLRRIDGNGVRQWAGALLASSTVADGNMEQHDMVGDGSGGVYIVWQDDRNDADDIYAQHIDADGNYLFSADKEQVCDEEGAQRAPKITLGKDNKAVVAWRDYRTGSGWDIYATSLDASGNPGGCGSKLDGGGGTASEPAIGQAAQAGAFVAWSDYRAGTDNENVYGALTASGGEVQVCTASKAQGQPAVAGSGTATVVAWEDKRTDDGDIYARAYQGYTWASAVCTASSLQRSPFVLGDGKGGAFIAWNDFRDVTVAGQSRVYLQYIDKNGSPQMPVNGMPICTDLPVSCSPPFMTMDSNGGVVIVWARGGTVVAQRLVESGGTSCPVCTGDPVILQGVIFPSGTDCTCTAATSITLGPGVTIQNGAKAAFTAGTSITINGPDVTIQNNAEATFQAPTIVLMPGVTIQPGAMVSMRQ